MIDTLNIELYVNINSKYYQEFSFKVYKNMLKDNDSINLFFIMLIRQLNSKWNV